MAYYMGKSLGKRKLYESVSPNKTLAGGVGSLIGSVAAALIIKALLVPHMPLGVAALTGAVIGAVAVVGDLVESMFKRDAGVKDSSTLIPGHGGVLDKVDGPIFAGPVLWWVLRGFEIIR
jgi:phosphatidate cytidylyltransferase